MKKYKTGLIVGKFAPLHKGHEFAISTAFAQCDTVMILTYSKPELPGCAVERREGWIKTLFPDALVLALDDRRAFDLLQCPLPDNAAADHVHREFVADICRHGFKRAPDAVFTSEDYGPGFAVHLQQSLGTAVAHVPVDNARTHVPISGTALRADIHGNRAFLSAPVYADFVQTVCFLGAESTGKSTFAKLMAEHYETGYVPEYGRTLWEEKSGKLDFEDLRKIAERHVQNEDAARMAATKFLFIDTSPLTTLFYSESLFDKADPALRTLADRPYDHIFLCHPDFPLVQDGTRSDESFRQKQHKWYVAELNRRALPYTALQGAFEHRLDTIHKTLSC